MRPGDQGRELREIELAASHDPLAIVPGESPGEHRDPAGGVGFRGA
jgi:hypothetical protein